MRTCIYLCVKVYFKHNLYRNRFMLNIAYLRISIFKVILACLFSLVLTVKMILQSVVMVNNWTIATLDYAEDLLDRLAANAHIRKVFKYKFVQGFSVFLILSALVFGFMIKVSDALVIEAQGRYISEQKFLAQVDQDTPDDIFLKKKERLNE